MGRAAQAVAFRLTSSGRGVTELWAISTPLWAVQLRPSLHKRLLSSGQQCFKVDAGAPIKQVLNSHGEGAFGRAWIGHTLRCPFRRERGGYAAWRAHGQRRYV